MDVLVVAGCALLGLVTGSFANVVIHRVPAGASIVSPQSACPGCETPIRPYDNVPVLSWLVLRGRCRDCHASISVRYPLVELATAVLFGLVGARFGLDPALPAFLLFTWLLLVVAVIDAETRKIPNRLTYPLTPVLLVLLVAAALVAGEPGALVRAALAGLAASGALLLLALIYPAGMGIGDVKLAVSLGLVLGYLSWGHVLVGVAGGFLLGAIGGVAVMVVGGGGRKTQIPFGPYLALGAFVALLAGGALSGGYLRLTGLA